MREYEFTLKFRLPGGDADPEQFIDALAEAGCDDATVGIGQPGRIALAFNRESGSAFEAITSAVREVRTAIPGAELVEASPDFVGLTDVADLMGCTRQNIRKLMLTHRASFPDAVHEGTQAFWHLHQVLDWFTAAQKRNIDHALLEVSAVTMSLNITKQTRRLPNVKMSGELNALIA